MPTPDEAPDDRAITDPVWRQAAAAADRTALILGDRVLSYGRLTAAADAVAAALRPRLAGRLAPRVALVHADKADLVVALLGAWRAGAVACPIDPALPTAPRQRLLAELAPDLLLKGADPPTLPAAPASSAPASSAPASSTPPAVGAAEPFLISFTAGSTGRPKGVLRSHGSWLASLAAARREFPLACDETVLIPGPLVHSLFLFALIETLAAGATARLMPRFTAAAALADLAVRPVSRMVGVPTMYAALADAAPAGARLPQPRMLVSAGAKLAPAVAGALRRLCPAARLVEYYGASELSFVTLADGAEGCPAGSVGRPFAGVEIAVRRADGGPAAPGAVGEVWVRSRMLAEGYVSGDGGWRTDAGGWATVGDLGRQDADGWLHLAGRADGMLVSGGRNLYPAEVEQVLAACPAVAEAVVLGLPDPYWGERLVAVVRWRPGHALALDRLRAHCRAHLAPYACPKQVFVAEAIPMTATGKPALARLRRALLDRAGPFRELTA
jgi:acyl-CoA synthetase (AMP-forming)/AMP-acid ligase II